MKKYLFISLFILSFSSLIYCQPIPIINRIKPSEFTPSENCPKMPAQIVKYLEEMSCTIPQASFIKNHHNAFQIQFGSRGQSDWAVLCSLNGFTSILVFWNSSIGNVSEIAKYPEKDFVRADGFFRVIGKTIRKPLTERNIETYGDIISKIESGGIDEVTPDRKSIIYYIYNRQLVTLENGR